jgi:peptidoglycan/LPS O-acetylase OafA/YrhL
MKTVQHRFIALDGLRGIAALAVLTIHMGGIPARLLPGAYLAVDFFFCLSGFVLAHAYGESALSFSSFLKARAIRLYPLYLAGLILGVAAAVIVGVSPAVIGAATAVSIFFMPTPFAVTGLPGTVGGLYPLNPPAWSLLFEILANATWFPLRVVFRRAPSLVLVIAAALFVASVLVYGAATAGGYWTNAWGGVARVTFSFFAGATIYQIWRRAAWRPRAPFWLVGAALLLIFVLPMPREAIDIPAVLFSMPALVYFGACCSPSARASDIMQRVLGDASYAVYVLHFPVILIVDRVVAPGMVHRSLVTTPLTVGIVVILALWLDRAYDRPVRRFLSATLVHKNSRASAAAANT